MLPVSLSPGPLFQNVVCPRPRSRVLYQLVATGLLLLYRVASVLAAQLIARHWLVRRRTRVLILLVFEYPASLGLGERAVHFAWPPALVVRRVVLDTAVSLPTLHFLDSADQLLRDVLFDLGALDCPVVGRGPQAQILRLGIFLHVVRVQIELVDISLDMFPRNLEKRLRPVSPEDRLRLAVALEKQIIRFSL